MVLYQCSFLRHISCLHIIEDNPVFVSIHRIKGRLGQECWSGVSSRTCLYLTPHCMAALVTDARYRIIPCCCALTTPNFSHFVSLVFFPRVDGGGCSGMFSGKGWKAPSKGHRTNPNEFVTFLFLAIKHLTKATKERKHWFSFSFCWYSL